jgi:hypothetical protein
MSEVSQQGREAGGDNRPNPIALLFPYQRDARDFLAEASIQGAVVLCGGHGTGKSKVLELLREKWQDKQPICISGAERHAAMAQISTQAGDGAALNPLIIDDLDRLLRPHSGDEPKSFRCLVNDLTALFTRGLSAPRRNIVAASSLNLLGTRAQQLAGQIDQEYFSQSVGPFSQLLLAPKPIVLNPWGRNWERSVEDLFESMFPDGELAEAWGKVIIDLTGGHPALLCPALTHVQLLLADMGELEGVDRALVDQTKFSQRTEEQIRLWVEDLLANAALARIRSVIRHLGVSTDPDAAMAYGMLLRLPTQAEDLLWTSPEAYRARAILIEDGLLYRNHLTGSYKIPGRLVSDYLRGISFVRSEPSSSSEPRLEAHEDEENCGRLIYGDKDVELRGQSWKNIRKLLTNKGQYLALDEFEGGRNGIKRLRDELKILGLDDRLENEYKRGYRFT